MKNNIRSEYIKNLVEDKNRLNQKLEEATKSTLQGIVDETLNKELRKIISEANDDFEVEEVEPDTDDALVDAGTTDGDKTDSETDDTVGDEGGEVADSTEGGEDDATGEEVWGELEQYKGEDGEYDLTGMDKESVIKVLKVMSPEDGVRVLKNDNGTVTLTDDETDKEYIIDMDGTMGGDTEAATEGDGDLEFEVEVEECTKHVNEGEVDLGYTDDYQKQTAMTVDNNDEPADPKNTYSMDAGVPKGTKKPWANKGDQKPYDKKVNEGEACDKCGKTPCNCDEKTVNETMTSTENSANARNTGMTHANTNSKGKKFRNSSEGGVKVKGTGENSYTNEQVESIMKKANAIFEENKQLRAVAESIKEKLEESIVVNSSLGSIIKLVTENTTSKQEKVEIVNRFNNVKTVNESKQLYNVIAEELNKAGKRLNNAGENALNNQIAESKKTAITETTMYQSDDLSTTLSLMERLNRIK